MKVKCYWWIDYEHISVLYKFQIDISTNSRELIYRNIEIWAYAFYMLNVTHVPLTYESHFFQLIDNDPISVLYEFQIDISTNSWEIKYQNMDTGLLHVKRRTRQKLR